MYMVRMSVPFLYCRASSRATHVNMNRWMDKRTRPCLDWWLNRRAGWEELTWRGREPQHVRALISLKKTGLFKFCYILFMNTTFLFSKISKIGFQALTDHIHE